MPAEGSAEKIAEGEQVTSPLRHLDAGAVHLSGNQHAMNQSAGFAETLFAPWALASQQALYPCTCRHAPKGSANAAATAEGSTSTCLSLGSTNTISLRPDEKPNQKSAGSDHQRSWLPQAGLEPSEAREKACGLAQHSTAQGTAQRCPGARLGCRMRADSPLASDGPTPGTHGAPLLLARRSCTSGKKNNKMKKRTIST